MGAGCALQTAAAVPPPPVPCTAGGGALLLCGACPAVGQRVSTGHLNTPDLAVVVQEWVNDGRLGCAPPPVALPRRVAERHHGCHQKSACEQGAAACCAAGWAVASAI